MANYSTLKAAVADVVKTNGTQAITGANLQAVLLSIINSVGGGGYIFKGVATPSTDAGTPDENVFYIGGAGTYANFGTSVTVPVGSIGVFKYNGSWTKEMVSDGLLSEVNKTNQELDDVEGLIGTSYTTATPVTDTEKDNYYIGPSGGLVTNNYYTISTEITLPAKSAICFTALGVVGNVSVLAKYLFGSGSSTRYTPLVVCNNSAAKRYFYLNQTDNPIGVYICSEKTTFSNSYSILPLGLIGAIGDTSQLATSEKSSLVGAVNELSSDNSTLLSFLGVSLSNGTPVIDTEKDGYYIGSTGGLITHSGYTISTEITLPAKATIFFSALGVANAVGVLAEYSSGSGSGTRYKVLVLADTTALKQYSYTNLSDSPIGVYICSNKNNFGVPYQIFTPIESENPTLYNGGDARIFNKGLCVGDSLTAGTFNYSQGGSTANYINITKYSYPTKLSEIMGIDITNAGQGGMTSDEWYAYYENTELTGYDFAIIQLGVNDFSEYGGWTQTSIDAFTNIINKLKNENTNIKIFVATILPATSYGGRESISAGIRTLVANLADDNVILLDMAVYSQVGTSEAYNCGHLSAYGYWKIAQEYYNYISWYINNHKMVFREVQFIGTDYHYS